MSVPPSKQLKSPPYPVAPENPPAWSRWARSIMSMLDVTFRKITKQVTDIVINMPDLTTGVQGDVMYNNGTKWTGLGYGTAGKKLQTNGAASNPTWETVTATSVTNTPAGNIASTDVQAAINELDTEKAAASHNHAAGDVTSGTFDTARIPAITEAMQSLSDNTTCDVSSSKHGYVPKLTNDTTKFLRDDGVFATIPSDHGWTNEAHTGNARLTDLDANMIHTTTGMRVTHHVLSATRWAGASLNTPVTVLLNDFADIANRGTEVLHTETSTSLGCGESTTTLGQVVDYLVLLSNCTHNVNLSIEF